MTTPRIETDSEPNVRPTCGIVMPISDTAGYPVGHWADVLDILKEALSGEFDTELVSKSNEVSFIPKTIVENLYTKDIVICDVSSKNPNVMFELGMRLTFDKPTVIVSDFATAFVFDIASIEHLQYRVDLRFGDIVQFKQNLLDKVRATHEKAKSDPNYSPFLRHFGQYRVSTLASESVTEQQYFRRTLSDFRDEILSELRASNLLAPRMIVGQGPNIYVSQPIEGKFKRMIIYPISSDGAGLDELKTKLITELRATLPMGENLQHVEVRQVSDDPAEISVIFRHAISDEGSTRLAAFVHTLLMGKIHSLRFE